jgi:hypothetical protein
MKIVINTGSNWSSRYIVLDSKHAALAAEILAHAVICEDDGSTPDGKHYKLDREAALTITYASDAQFGDLPESVYAARKQAEDANSARWKEHTRANDAEKRVAELTARLESLESRITCTVQPEAETETETEADRAE